MADQRPDRRRILKGAGALGAVGALAALQGPMAAHAADTTGPEGSWRAIATPEGTGAPPPF